MDDLDDGRTYPVDGGPGPSCTATVTARPRRSLGAKPAVDPKVHHVDELGRLTRRVDVLEQLLSDLLGGNRKEL
jgi:hypothetical protein